MAQVLSLTFMVRISSEGAKDAQLGDVRTASLLFPDDVVLLASLSHDLQLLLEQFSGKCEGAGLSVST